MGRIVSNFFISLDGIVEAPHEWHFPYFSDAMGAVIGSGMETQSGFLLGRRLYDEWSEYWPGNTEDGFSDYINNVPKYVLTHSEVARDWNNTTVLSESDDVAMVARVQQVKDDNEGDLGMSGCATTVRWLLAHDLLDELALLVHPIAVAKGQRLFEDTGTVPLTLTSHDVLPNGVLHLRYAPDRG